MVAYTASSLRLPPDMPNLGVGPMSKNTEASFQERLIQVSDYLTKLATRIPLNKAIQLLRELGLLEAIENQAQSGFLRRLEE